MRNVILVATASLCLSGCYEKDTIDQGVDKAITSIEKVEIADNSPDATVKSWWRLKDGGAALLAEVCRKNLKVSDPYFQRLSELSTDNVHNERSCAESPSTFDRQITKVEVESDTRAIVTAVIKNVTPPEQGAVLDEADRKAKDAGEPYKYVLERKDLKSGWKISEVSHYPSYARTWEKAFKKPEPSTNRWVHEWFQ